MMLEAFLERVERRFRHRFHIKRHGQRYLDRTFVFRTGPIAFFLHRFWQSDPDPFHDHPWNNCSIILTGDVIEHSVDGRTRSLRRFRPYFRQAEVFHRLELPAGQEGRVWTLFVRFRRRRRWGFLDAKWDDANVDTSEGRLLES